MYITCTYTPHGHSAHTQTTYSYTTHLYTTHHTYHTLHNAPTLTTTYLNIIQTNTPCCMLRVIYVPKYTTQFTYIPYTPHKHICMHKDYTHLNPNTTYMPHTGNPTHIHTTCSYLICGDSAKASSIGNLWVSSQKMSKFSTLES